MPRPIRHCDTSMAVLLDRAVAMLLCLPGSFGQFCHKLGCSLELCDDFVTMSAPSELRRMLKKSVV